MGLNEQIKDLQKIIKKINSYREFKGKKVHHLEHIFAQSVYDDTDLGYECLNYIKKKQEIRTINKFHKIIDKECIWLLEQILNLPFDDRLTKRTGEKWFKELVYKLNNRLKCSGKEQSLVDGEKQNGIT